MIEFMAVEDMLFDIQEFQQRTVDRHALKDLNEFVTKVNQIQITTVQPQLSFQNQLQQRVEEHSNMQASGLSGAHTGYTNLNQFTDGWQATDRLSWRKTFCWENSVYARLDTKRSKSRSETVHGHILQL